MKAWFSTNAVLGLALSVFPFVGACTQQSGNTSPLINSANAEPAVNVVTSGPVGVPSAAFSAPALATSAAPSANEIAVAPVPAPGADKKPLPPIVRSNTPAADVIKLAQAGVDEPVMLAFITNTTSQFGLTSDEIIYLNDLGVPNTVVTAMMQHDQAIKEFWSNSAKAQAAQAAAAAPTYVNPPQPEPQPTVTVDASPAPAPQPVSVTYNYFNDSLSPYGTWIEVEGYGRCWQPTAVVLNRDWRPYGDRGHWVYTDSGWYWLSDYSWGATTFHYGRWFSHPRWGWCWWPDTVWAPSWVSWRYSGDYCGWAPLPPAAYYRSGFGFSYQGRSVGFSFDFGLGAASFTFVPWGRFCDSRPFNHRVPHHQVTQVYHNTTIVNNYITGNNNTVINRGIPTDRVREHTHTEIRQVSIRDAGGSHIGRGERLERDGRTLIVNRQEFPGGNAPANHTPPRPRAESSSATLPVAGAGAAALTDRSNDTRDRNHRPPNYDVRTTVATPAVQPHNNNGTIPRGRDEQRPPGNTTVNPNNENQRGGGSPVIVGGPRGSGKVSVPGVNPSSTANPPAIKPSSDNPAVVIGRRDAGQPRESITTTTSPSRTGAPTIKPSGGNPVVVIGRRDAGQPRNNNSTTTSPSPGSSPAGAPAIKPPVANPLVVVGHRDSGQPVVPDVNTPRRSENIPPSRTEWADRARAAQTAQAAAVPQIRPTPAPAANPAPRFEQRETPRTYQNQQRNYPPTQSAPTYTAPRASAPQPVYTPPVVAAPAPRSAPSYTPPPQSQPAPAAAAPQPQRSQNTESRSQSGGGNNGRNRQER
ncbi:MAG: hypothetical protein EXS35_05415 [Pedosphaera sp.]|nr:hypothetical protein [Pedosphaera sp.]